MEDVTTDSHLQRTCQCFEDTFNLVVFVLSFSMNVEVHACSIAERFEEMQEHLGGNVADALTLEVSIPYEPGAATKVEGNGAETVIHWQAIAITLYAALGAESLIDAITESECCILDGVVLIYVEVTFGMNGKVNHAVTSDLFEHVVEETEARLNVALACTIEVDTYQNVRLLGGAAHFGRAFTSKDNLCHLSPFAYLLEAAADVLGKEPVSITVTDDVAVGYVVLRVVHVFLDESSVRLACRSIVLREMAVNEYVVEGDAFAF